MNAFEIVGITIMKINVTSAYAITARETVSFCEKKSLKLKLLNSTLWPGSKTQSK